MTDVIAPGAGRARAVRPYAPMATGSRLISSAALANGLKLPYVEQGDPAGVPVVFLHAFADSWRTFERVFPFLPRSIRAIALTQRGHGDADRPASGYGVEDFTADVGAFMDTIGLEAAVIVASSSASLTAQRFAAEHPRRTLGLAFIGAPRSLRDKPGLATFIDEVRQLRDPIDPAFVREFVEATVSGPVPPAFLEMVIAENLKVPAGVWKATLEGLVESIPATETATITAPSLILWGDRDGFLPRSDQEALAAAIPGSQLVVYEGTGHVVHWEEPERVAADLGALVERVLPAQFPRADGS
jgi:non-heme chloroperoxidase